MTMLACLAAAFGVAAILATIASDQRMLLAELLIAVPMGALCIILTAWWLVRQIRREGMKPYLEGIMVFVFLTFAWTFDALRVLIRTAARTVGYQHAIWLASSQNRIWSGMLLALATAFVARWTFYALGAPKSVWTDVAWAGSMVAWAAVVVWQLDPMIHFLSWIYNLISIVVF